MQQLARWVLSSEKRRKKSLPKDPKRVQSLGRFCRLDTGQVGMEKQVYALE